MFGAPILTRRHAVSRRALPAPSPATPLSPHFQPKNCGRPARNADTIGVGWRTEPAKDGRERSRATVASTDGPTTRGPRGQGSAPLRIILGLWVDFRDARRRLTSRRLARMHCRLDSRAQSPLSICRSRLREPRSARQEHAGRGRFFPSQAHHGSSLETPLGVPAGHFARTAASKSDHAVDFPVIAL